MTNRFQRIQLLNLLVGPFSFGENNAFFAYYRLHLFIFTQVHSAFDIYLGVASIFKKLILELIFLILYLSSSINLSNQR